MELFEPFVRLKVRDKVSMFPELRAVQIEVPGDILEMREGSDEVPAHEAGAPFSLSAPIDVKTHGDSLRRMFHARTLGLLRDRAATRGVWHVCRTFSVRGQREDMSPSGGKFGSDLGSRGLPP
jgi:hypothetical protein